jgi:archaellum component FlaC
MIEKVLRFFCGRLYEKIDRLENEIKDLKLEIETQKTKFQNVVNETNKYWKGILRKKNSNSKKVGVS